MNSSNRSIAAIFDGAPENSSPVARLFYSPPSGLSGRLPPHPGRMLQSHFLAPSGLTQGDLAKRLGISRRRVNELLNGRRGITPDTALRLAAHFNTDPWLWTAW
jgi:addiction module HigA family antidote